jgi:hypothetical protein
MAGLRPLIPGGAGGGEKFSKGVLSCPSMKSSPSAACEISGSKLPPLIGATARPWITYITTPCFEDHGLGLGLE